MLMDQKKRIAWIDIFRGLMIILVVVGHTWSPLNSQIYLFHVPAFFFISGYVSNTSKSWQETIIKSLFFRLIPFLFWNLFLIIICYIIEKSQNLIIFTNGSLLNQIRNLFLYGYTTDMGGATWFILALFWCELYAKFCSSVGCKFNLFCEVLFTLLIVFAGYIIADLTFDKPYCFDLGMIALLYFMIGNWIKKYNVNEQIDTFSFGIICFIIYLFHAIWWKYHQNWPTRTFGHIPVTIVGSFTGIYLCCLLSKVIDKFKIAKIFRIIGNRTYAIMCWHFIAFRIISIVLWLSGLIDKISISTFPTPVNYWYIYAPFSIIICIFISKLSDSNRITNYFVNGKLIFTGKMEASDGTAQ